MRHRSDSSVGASRETGGPCCVFVGTCGRIRRVCWRRRRKIRQLQDKRWELPALPSWTWSCPESACSVLRSAAATDVNLVWWNIKLHYIQTTWLKWPQVQVTAVPGFIEQADSLIKEIPKHNLLLSSINPLTIPQSFKELAQTLVCKATNISSYAATCWLLSTLQKQICCFDHIVHGCDAWLQSCCTLVLWRLIAIGNQKNKCSDV